MGIYSHVPRGGDGLPRPIKPRWIEFMPRVTYFKPAGVPLSTLIEVSLGVDELEAIRLKDLVGLEQEECAERMGVAQSTFQRILTSARHKVASALIEGKAIRIEGGNYRFAVRRWECSACGHRWQSSSEPEVECPECGSAAVREHTCRQEMSTPSDQDQGSVKRSCWGYGRGRGPHRGPRSDPGDNGGPNW